MDRLDTPSPNFDERTLPISMIVLHYTGMQDAASARARLCDPEAKVSSHYLLDEDGTLHRLVARNTAPGMPAHRTGAASPTSIRRASGSRSSIRGMNGAIARSRGADRGAAAAGRGHQGAPRITAAISSAIPTSRRCASVSGRAVPLARLARLRLALPGRRAICSTRCGRRQASCSRSNASAMTSPIRWRRSWRSSAASAPN